MSHVHWPFLSVSQEAPECGVRGSQGRLCHPGSAFAFTLPQGSCLPTAGPGCLSAAGVWDLVSPCGMKELANMTVSLRFVHHQA